MTELIRAMILDKISIILAPGAAMNTYVMVFSLYNGLSFTSLIHKLTKSIQDGWNTLVFPASEGTISW